MKEFSTKKISFMDTILATETCAIDLERNSKTVRKQFWNT